MKTDNYGKIHYGLLLLTTLITVFMMIMLLELRLIVYKRDTLSDGILLSNLSACAADAEEFVAGMDVIIKEDGTYDIKTMAETAVVRIDEHRALHELERLLEQNCTNEREPWELAEFIVYNVDGGVIRKDAYKDGVWSSELFSGCIFTPNGVPVERSCVYARVKTVVNGLIVKNREVFLENCVMLRLNEDLQ